MTGSSGKGKVHFALKSRNKGDIETKVRVLRGVPESNGTQANNHEPLLCPAVGARGAKLEKTVVRGRGEDKEQKPGPLKGLGSETGFRQKKPSAKKREKNQTRKNTSRERGKR